MPTTLTRLLSICIILTAPALTNASRPFAPYADLTINNIHQKKTHDYQPYDLVKIVKRAGVKNIRLAFIVDAGNCEPSWQGSRMVRKKWALPLLMRLNKSGINYTISFGGPEYNDLSTHCSPDQLISTYENIIHLYQPKGLDFDIEHPKTNIPNMMAALQSIQKKYPNLELSFTLPVLPTGFTDPVKNIVQAAQQANLKYAVNIMTMDYGNDYKDKNMGEFATQAASSVHDFLKTLYPQANDADLWQMIEVTPMIGKNSIPNETFTLTDADTLKNFAKQKNLGRLSMWSIGRDHPCKTTNVSPICSSKNSQTRDYEFAKKFMEE